MSVPDPVAALTAWMQAAQPGQRFRYYDGFMGAACIPGIPQSDVAFSLRKASSDAYLTGLYELTQERHGEMHYSYWITRRRVRDVEHRWWYVTDRLMVSPIHYARKHGVPA